LHQIFKNLATLKADNWLNELFSNKTTSGSNVSEETALKFSAVYSCVRIISETIGSLPFNLKQYTNNGSEIARNNPLQKIIHSEPNDFMTSMVFRETMTGQLCLYGNAYSIITRKKGEVTAITPVMSKDVTVKVAKNEIFYDITTNGTTKTYTAFEILHIPLFGFDGIVGKSPIKLHAESIGIGLAANEFAASFYGNGANVTGLLSTPEKLDDTKYKSIITRWRDRFAGGGKKGNQTALLDMGMKYDRIGIPPEEAQFIETRKFQITDIARIYRVPPHLLADLEKATNNNIEEQGIDFVRHCIRNYVIRWEQECNRKLIKEADKGSYYFEMNMEALLRGNSEQRAKFYQMMLMNGTMSPNEIREKEGLNKIVDGDKYYLPLNITTIEKLNKIEQNGQ